MARMTHFKAFPIQSPTAQISQKAIQLFVWLSVGNNGKGMGPKNVHLQLFFISVCLHLVHTCYGLGMSTILYLGIS